MKRYFTFLLSITGLLLYSQVALGKQNVSNGSVSLEFGNVAGTSMQKGILLPWVTSSNAVNTPEPGTLIYDISDYKVKYYQGGNTPTWVDLSVDNRGTTEVSATDNLSVQVSLAEKPNAKVAIGTPSNIPGIFVLEATDKAMILPLVDSYKSIIKPSAGMMAYDLSENLLCFFNGSYWSFWKAE